MTPPEEETPYAFTGIFSRTAQALFPEKKPEEKPPRHSRDSLFTSGDRPSQGGSGFFDND